MSVDGGVLNRTGFTPGSRTTSERARLVAEILRQYVPALRTVRGGDLPAMVHAARAVDRRPRCNPADPHEESIRLGWIVMRTLSLLPTDGRCLVRALVLTRLLTRRGVPTRLVIGVKPGPGFAAHAWVEHDGTPVLPTEGFDHLHEL